MGLGMSAEPEQVDERKVADPVGDPESSYMDRLLSGEGWRDGYGEYIPSTDTDPVPPFPCETDPECTADNRVCLRHRMVLFFRHYDPETQEVVAVYETPVGAFECWMWHRLRISEVSGLPPDSFRLVFAGAERQDFDRHSGLQYQSTVHLIMKPGG